MAFCTNCGNNNKDGIKFCIHCGSLLPETPAAAPAAPVTPAETPAAATPASPFPTPASPADAFSKPADFSAPASFGDAPASMAFPDPTIPVGSAAQNAATTPAASPLDAAAPVATAAAGAAFAAQPSAAAPQPAPAPAPQPVPAQSVPSAIPTSSVPSQTISGTNPYVPTSGGYSQAPVYAAQSIPAYNQPKKTSGFAIAGFVLSLVSILCCGATGIIALILSIVGLIIALKGEKKGKGFAIAGIIISVILTAFFVIGFFCGGIESLTDYLEGITDESKAAKAEDLKETITGQNWVVEDEGAYLVFESGKKFTYYRSIDDQDNYYYEGKYKLFVGKEAIEYLTNDLEDYGITEEEIKDIIRKNDYYTEDNLILLVLINETCMIDGEDTLPEDTVTTPYVGFYVEEKDYYALDLTNMNAASYVWFIPESEYEK
ncbi:MAG: zinc-ribbon domain-containing protein [Clostridiales bacterium]|nr:zinc-ribbon domain-containing protein [Clostridiales bacterium]